MARSYRVVHRGAALAAAISLVSCAGGGGQSNVLVPQGSLNGQAAGGIGTTVVKIFVPSGSQAPVKAALPPISATRTGRRSHRWPLQRAPVTTPAPGSQLVSINVTGPTTITQTVSVGPNSERMHRDSRRLDVPALAFVAGRRLYRIRSAVPPSRLRLCPDRVTL